MVLGSPDTQKELPSSSSAVYLSPAPIAAALIAGTPAKARTDSGASRRDRPVLNHHHDVTVSLRRAPLDTDAWIAVIRPTITLKTQNIVHMQAAGLGTRPHRRRQRRRHASRLRACALGHQ
ncbi:hypothetical protein NMY22_g10914 [Coprinellus aureogranulatus]|nr:hypothetical protein NMY22_g10914 [Coprinellus aureogranulatus]